VAKEDNLTKFTKDNAKEMGRRGGLATARKNKRKKDMKQAMNMLLNMPVEGNLKEVIKRMTGFEDDEINYQLAMLVSVMQKALKGDMKAVQYITELTTMNETSKARLSIEKQQLKLQKEKQKSFENADSELQKQAISNIENLIEQMIPTKEDDISD